MASGFCSVGFLLMLNLPFAKLSQTFLPLKHKNILAAEKEAYYSLLIILFLWAAEKKIPHKIITSVCVYPA